MRTLVLFIGWALLCLVVIVLAEPGRGAKPPGPGTAPAAPASQSTAPQGKDADAPIRQMVAAFTKAYNSGDAKALASLFIVEAEIIDSEGQVVRGRRAIEDEFAAIFKQHPKAKIEIAIDSIRYLGPALAIEEGTSTVKYEPNDPGESGRYVVTYVKQDGRWQTVSAQEAPEEEADSNSLEQLSWLVGNWVDENPEALVKTSFRWDEDHTYLVGEFAIHIAGRPAMKGTNRIGWDPLLRQIRSWMFDSEGGFSESLWSPSSTNSGSSGPDRWVVKMSGVTRDGRAGSATNVFTRLGEDRYSFQSYDRIVGGVPTDDIPEIIVTREAPGPEK
jgi:uncharacterized protein (TIGR02246 family)